MPTQDRTHWPLWVRLGLWGLPTRGAAMAFLWLSLALAIAGAIGGFWNRLFLIGVGFLLSAAWYWIAIRWVDRNDSWGDRK